MAYDLPIYELFSKFTVPVMNAFLGAGLKPKQKAFGYSHNRHATYTVDMSCLAGQDCKIQRWVRPLISFLFQCSAWHLLDYERG